MYKGFGNVNKRIQVKYANFTQNVNLTTEGKRWIDRQIDGKMEIVYPK